MSGHVMVFAPAPQLTITVEEQGGEPDIHLHAGGQGVWQSRMIMSLGMPVVMCTTLGGETGRVLELDELYGLALAEGLRAEVSVLAAPTDPGVVPSDVYRRLAHDLGHNGCVVLADLSGEHLAEVLEGGVRFLKVSHEELIEDGRAASDDPDELARPAQTPLW